MENIFSLFSDAGAGQAISPEKLAVLQGASKLNSVLILLTKIVTPVVLVIALGLFVWALVGRLHGKVVDGEREKMGKGKFVGIIVTAVILVVFASVFASVLATTITGQNGLIFKQAVEGTDVDYTKFLTGGFTDAHTK